MNEQFLQYVWKHQLLDLRKLRSRKKEKIEVLSPGKINPSGGPDFIHAKIKIGDHLWYGSVEIHKDFSDWYHHGHHSDPRYNTVILHVYYSETIKHHDALFDQMAHLNIKGLVPLQYIRNYRRFTDLRDRYPCQGHLSGINAISKQLWLNRMAIERLEFQKKKIVYLLDKTNGNWDQVALVMIGRYFGMKLNNSNFEELLTQLPYTFLSRKRKSQEEIEAILYGTAGLLPKVASDSYTMNVIKDFNYLKSLYDLKLLSHLDWKFMRVRPANFPTVRIAQLASLLKGWPAMMDHILSFRTVEDIRKGFDLSASEYWNNHFRFGKVAKDNRSRVLGRGFVDNIILNALVPLIFSYGDISNKPEKQAFALELLESTDPEKNTLVRQWKESGIELNSALETQGLLHMSRQYCSHRRCTECSIGHSILSSRKEVVRNELAME